MTASLTICTKEEWRAVICFFFDLLKLFVACKCSIVDGVYITKQDLRIDRALQTGKGFLYMTTKYWAVHRRQSPRVVVVEGIVKKGMANIQSRYNTFRKQKADTFSSFLPYCR
ncbi:hypothetical protein TNCV_1518791 [Trichonephila clavipes]|nr:hypothetical protein TNCV_1518791 [Trichonephila clavipes]